MEKDSMESPDENEGSLAQAAESGDAEAQYRLGMEYYHGLGRPRDVIDAVKWWFNAASQGHIEAQHELGLCYVKGIGISEDRREGLRWLRKAAASGNPDAILALERHFPNGSEGIQYLEKEGLECSEDFEERGANSSSEALEEQGANSSTEDLGDRATKGGYVYASIREADEEMVTIIFPSTQIGYILTEPLKSICPHDVDKAAFIFNVAINLLGKIGYEFVGMLNSDILMRKAAAEDSLNDINEFKKLQHAFIEEHYFGKGEIRTSQSH